MATVTMDINELDKLRQDLKDKSKEYEDLRKELEDVKSDKRVVLKTKYKSYKEGDYHLSVDMSRLRHIMQYRYDTFTHGLDKEVRNCIKVYPIVSKDDNDTEFINFDDVKKEIREALEKDYAEELADLRQSKKYDIEYAAEKQKAHQKEIEKLNAYHLEVIEDYKKQILNWENKYSDLKNDKDMRTTEQKLLAEIEELKNSLIKEKSKTWWYKLWNK